MKFIADTHSHSLMSGHAYSTIKEMAKAAADRGLEMLALTEHAPKMPNTCGLYYFQNLVVIPRDMYGIKVLFGTELNIMNPAGEVDLPDALCSELDIVIASVHPPCYGKSRGIKENTQAYVNVMKNPYVHIIGHPDDARYPIDYEVLVKTAKETGTLLELNNSSLRPNSYREGAWENVSIMLELCKQYGVFVTTGSDAHVDVDAGNFCNIERLLKTCDFPEELVVTTDIKKMTSCLKHIKKYWTV